MIWLKALLSLAACGVALFGLHHFALWLERKGLLFYRDRKPTGGGGSALLGLQSMVEPAAKHVITIDEERHSDDADGDPEQ